MNATATFPPTSPAVPLLTAEEFLKLHGDESGVELVKGRLVRSPMPGGKHGQICGNAYFLLRAFVESRDLGRLMTNDTFVRVGTDPDTFRGADVCFLSYSRLPKNCEIPDGPIPVPDLVVEVRSPTDRLNQLTGKATEYLEAGVSAVVVLMPDTQTAAVYRSEELPIRLGSDEQLTLPDVLPGFAVAVRAFFQ